MTISVFKKHKNQNGDNGKHIGNNGYQSIRKISLIDSISLIVRVVSVPIGVLSNCERFKPNILLYTFTRMSFTTAWPSHEVIKEK